MDQLDLLLDRTREPEPSDDLFVARVMAEVRPEIRLVRGRRRFNFTRPVVLAGAAVLAFGGAVAAVVSTTQPKPDAPRVKASAPAHTSTVTGDEPTRSAGSTTKTGTSTSAAPSAGRSVFRHGELEWGYTSRHTAYVLDRSTGLKVITETHRDTFLVGKTHRVTMTLENTGSQPISLRAPKDCSLQVMAFDGATSRDASNFEPQDGPNAADARTWKCAGSTADPDADGATENIVLVGGERRSANALISMTSDTSVFGLCRCSYVDASDPADPIVQDPLSQLNQVVTPGGLIPFTAPTLGSPLEARSIDAFFTPPITLGRA